MKHFDVAPEAIGDLQEIWDFIADDSIEAADRVLDEFDDAFHQLAEMPGMGHRREDLTSRDVLFWTGSQLPCHLPDDSPALGHRCTSRKTERH